MTIAQEEIFGPVLSIIPYDDEDDAVADRQRHDLRPGRRRLVGRRGARAACRAAAAHRPGRDQRRRVQPARAVRRLQAVGPRPRARPVRPRGVPRDQVDPALMDFELSDRCQGLPGAPAGVHGRARLSRRAGLRASSCARPATRTSTRRSWRSSRPRRARRGLWNLFLPDERVRRRADQRRVRAAGRDHGPQPHRAGGVQLHRARHRQHGGAARSSARAEQQERWLRPLLDGEIRSASR